VLKTRNGRPFVEPTPAQEDMAAIAAALEAVLSPSTLAPGAADGRPERTASRGGWRTQARTEGLRTP